MTRELLRYCITGSLYQCEWAPQYDKTVCSVVQVAERALFLWNNDYIVGLVAHNRATILPILFGPLEQNARSHWNQVGECSRCYY